MNTADSMSNPPLKKGWQASLTIELEKHGFKTVMSKLHHFGPLRIQKPFYPEGHTSHIYILHPPGGVVGGDGLHIDIQASHEAHALFTTPGATKFYRSAGDTAKVVQHLTVAADSTLEWFPQENIFFPGAKAQLETQVNLEEGANFMGWEISCLGRPVNHELFSQGRADTRFRVNRSGRPLLIERLLVDDPKHLNAEAGLRHFPMQGMFLATGCDEELLQQARDRVEELQAEMAQSAPDMLVGFTLLDDLLVMRVLGTATEKIQALMIPVWQLLRLNRLGKQAVIPRIWNT